MVVRVRPLKSIVSTLFCAAVLVGCAGNQQFDANSESVLVEGPGSRLYSQVSAYFAENEATVLDQTEHHFAYTDLNSDGLLDVIVLLTDNEWCVGESCTALIFAGDETSVRPISKLTLINGPIALGEFVNQGWRDIFVRLPGRSDLTMARVSFDGDQYPNSPSRWGVDTVDGYGPGRLLIAGSREFESAYAAPTIAYGRPPALTNVPTSDSQDAAEMAALLAEADDMLGIEQDSVEVAASVEETRVALQPSTTRPVDGVRQFHGRYSWGPGEAFFRPCGGSSLYWVEAEEGVFADLDAQYRAIASLQYDDVFAIVQARRLPPAEEGSGSFYDGVLMVSALTTMEPLDGESCSRS